jgi:hypothetical protein
VMVRGGVAALLLKMKVVLLHCCLRRLKEICLMM